MKLTMFINRSSGGGGGFFKHTHYVAMNTSNVTFYKVIMGFMHAIFATIISNVESYMVSSVSLVLNGCLKSYKFPANL